MLVANQQMGWVGYQEGSGLTGGGRVELEERGKPHSIRRKWKKIKPT